MLGNIMKPRLRLIHQSVQSECALACLAMISAHLGRPVELRVLRQFYPSSSRGTSLREVLDIARELGLKPRPLRLEPGQIRRYADCLMLHWNFDHYVVFQGMRGSRYRILDPGKGALDITAEEFDRTFTGIAVSFGMAKAHVDLPPPGPRPTLWRIWPAFPKQVPVIALIIVTAIVLQGVQVGVPLLTAYIVDFAIPSASQALLIGTIGGMLALLLVASISRWVLRGLMIEYAQRVSRLMVLHLVERLTQLPIQWFHARDRGEILSRVTSSAQIQELAVSRGIPAVADTFVFLPALAVLAVLSPAITVTVLCALILIGVIHILAGRRQRAVEADRLRAGAASNGAVIELVSNIDSARIRNAEARRLNAWSGRYLDMLGAERRFETGERASDFAIEAVLALTTCIIIWIGTRAVTADTLSVGTLLAILMILALMTAALQRMATFLRLIHAVASHVENVATVLDEAVDPDALESGDLRLSASAAASMTIQLEGVSYRHPGAQTDVLRDVTLAIRPGETVGVVGSSGAGKSTLVALVTGLLSPRTGQVLVDGVPLAPGFRRTLRNRIGVVLQNDGLFQGSIADNISNFSEFPDTDRVVEAARLAEINAEVEALPLGYNTPIGDGGAPLSGGQLQRIMIARALYDRPKLLILDEGTANLNLELESRIHHNVAATDMSRLIITHRPQILADWADRIVEVRGNTLVERGLREAAE